MGVAHVSLHAATEFPEVSYLHFQVATRISWVMHACPQSTAGTIPLSGRGSTYPAQTAKHIPDW